MNPGRATYYRVTRLAITLAIAAVWFVNALYCKVLGLVPRHEHIVARILGGSFSREITVAIGLAELLMVVWILSRIAPRLCAAVQIAIVLLMNILEYLLAPDLLLFGRWNVFWASLFCLLVYANEFLLADRRPSPSNI